MLQQSLSAVKSVDGGYRQWSDAGTRPVKTGAVVLVKGYELC
jgi:hypothetical protein